MCNLSENELANIRLGAQTTALLRTIVVVPGEGKTPHLGRMLMYRYYLEQQGLRRCLSRLVSGFFHIKSFGILRQGLRRILPTPTKSLQCYLYELENNIRSDHQATNALQLLVMEFMMRTTSDSQEGDTMPPCAYGADHRPVASAEQ
jgi:hypothetical protein